MPIYEYVCETCDAPHEALQKINDTPLTDCPSCGQSSLKKQISAPGFRLSGSGWYETDFKSGKQRNLAESKDKAKKESQDKVKKESKPAHSCGAGACGTSS